MSLIPLTRASALGSAARRPVLCPSTHRPVARASRPDAAVQRLQRAGIIVRFKPDTDAHQSTEADAVEQLTQDAAKPAGTSPNGVVNLPSEPELVPVVFSLQKRCEFGDAYAIVGAAPELGGWDTSAALTLQWHEDDVWSATAALPVGTPVFFKYIRTHNGDCVEWSDGSDLQVTVSSKGSASPGLLTEAYTVNLEGGDTVSIMKVALASDPAAPDTAAAALADMDANAQELSALSPQQQQQEQQGQSIKASDLPQGSVAEPVESAEQGGGAFDQKEGVAEALQEALEPQLVDSGPEASPAKGSSAIITEDAEQQQGQSIKASDLPQGSVTEPDQPQEQGGGAFDQKEGVAEALQEALEPQLVDSGLEASPAKGSSAIITVDAQQQGQSIKASELPQGSVAEPVPTEEQGGGAFDQKEGVTEALQEALEPQLVDSGPEASPAKGSSAIITEDAEQQQGQSIKASDLPQGSVAEPVPTNEQGGGAFDQKEGVAEALQEALEPQLVDSGPEASPAKGSSAIITEDAKQQAPAPTPDHTDAAATGGTPDPNSLVTDAIPAPAGTEWAKSESAPDATGNNSAADVDGKASSDRVAAAAVGKEPPVAAQDAAAAVLPQLLKGGGALKDAAGQLLAATPQQAEPEADTTPAETANAVAGGMEADTAKAAAGDSRFEAGTAGVVEREQDVKAAGAGVKKGKDTENVNAAAVESKQESEMADAVAGGPELEDAQDRQGALAPAGDAVSNEVKDVIEQAPVEAKLDTEATQPMSAQVDVGPGQPAWPAVEEGLDKGTDASQQAQAPTKSVEEAESKVKAAAEGAAVQGKGVAGPLSLLYLVGGWLLGK